MDTKLITQSIVELLQRNGPLKYDDLFKRVKKTHNEFNDADLNIQLMRMEIQGLVKVYRIPRGKRRVELA